MYYPEFLKPYFAQLMLAEDAEFDEAWEKAEQALKDVHVFLATQAGLERWEKILKIVPKAKATIQDRRFEIRSRLAQAQIVTEESLRESLTALTGPDGYQLEVNGGEFTVNVKIELGAKLQFDTVVELLKNRLPANLIIRVELYYNTHERIATKTHAYLSTKTHYEIRNEVL